jgi:N-acetylmuramoyl-L-alanine amidase
MNHLLRQATISGLTLLASWVAPAAAAVRVEAVGVPPFALQEMGHQDTTAWYDAEDLLRHFPGMVERDSVYGRITYREAGHWVTLKAAPPYVIRDGRPVRGVPALRSESGRILLPERFLRDFATEVLGRSLRVRREGRGRRVVVDPGHGGQEGGSAGPGGLLEKDVVLELARSVGDALKSRGFDVHYTRTGDHAIGSSQRAAVANYWEADLFLSLHAAGSGRPQVRGFEVFVVPAPDAEVHPRAWQDAQRDWGDQSLRWAKGIREALGHSLPTFDRGVGELPNPVLEAVAAPACLVELGSLAWPRDAEALRTAAGRSAAANAIAEAAEAFFQGHD